MTKLLLVGGYPKGHAEPFHPDTVSGSRLHKWIEKYNLDVILYDLWNDREQEVEGELSEANLLFVRQFIWMNGDNVIALGQHVYKCMTKAGLKCKYLPHPASRSKTALFTLLEGLKNASN